jgi:ABC-type transport system involved in multi-copper enzyme maturation permease subunit
MATLPGALLAMWIAVCILTAIFFTVAAISCLVCTVSPPKDGVSRMEALSGFFPCFLLAGLFYIHIGYLLSISQKTPETPKTRDILLTVPETSSVNAQVISGNNTVNIKNL